MNTNYMFNNERYFAVYMIEAIIIPRLFDFYEREKKKVILRSVRPAVSNFIIFIFLSQIEKEHI